jgi:hypothetical protein
MVKTPNPAGPGGGPLAAVAGFSASRYARQPDE